MSATPHSSTPHEIVERTLELSRADGCVVIADEHSSANLRWARNALTTNGVTRGRTLTVIATVDGAQGTATGVVTRSAVTADDLEPLVRAAEAAAREAGPAEDAGPLVSGGAPAADFTAAPAAPTTPPAPAQAPAPAYPAQPPAAHATPPATPAPPATAPPAITPAQATPHPAAAPAQATPQPTAPPHAAAPPPSTPAGTPASTPALTPPPAPQPHPTPQPTSQPQHLHQPPAPQQSAPHATPAPHPAAPAPHAPAAAHPYGYPHQPAGAQQAYGYPQAPAAGQHPAGFGPAGYATAGPGQQATGAGGFGAQSPGAPSAAAGGGDGTPPRKRGRGKLVALGAAGLLVFAAAGGATTYVLLKDDDKKTDQADQAGPAEQGDGKKKSAGTPGQPKDTASGPPTSTPDGTSDGSDSASPTAPTVIPDPKPVQYNGINLPDDYHLFFAADPIKPDDGDTKNDVVYTNSLGDRSLSTQSNGSKLVLLNNAQEGSLDTCRTETRFATTINFDRIPKGARICVRTGSGHIGLVTFNGFAPESDPSDYIKIDLTVWRNALEVEDQS
ncbi:hypothetical protein AAHZ94_19270 [Streptomyces sp. HSW2009]|uniref:hypothetical protein n=1 Tax=Streptomyces sp. HSW2009 TaxID=3142890 RepID=UPI0032EC919D